ncbi:hypothetical protein AURDEDRAFT_165807 [Auricularia subglabra TFB-10046 SS5]|nr:hypothetical protein AURDEDRAFT_165807 [Auricularia subglabra TFB-10046 SS5]
MSDPGGHHPLATRVGEPPRFSSDSRHTLPPTRRYSILVSPNACRIVLAAPRPGLEAVALEIMPFASISTRGIVSRLAPPCKTLKTHLCLKAHRTPTWTLIKNLTPRTRRPT